MHSVVCAQPSRCMRLPSPPRIRTGQNVAHIDSLFTGNILGHKSDIADGSLRAYEFRTFDHIVGDYYVAPSFLEKVAMHMTKNYLCDMGCFSSRIKVPLILGICEARASRART